MPFNVKAVLENVNYVKNLVRAIRQKDGIGSDADELILSRLLLDVDFLLEMSNTLANQNKDLKDQLQQLGGKNVAADGKQNVQSDQALA